MRKTEGRTEIDSPFFSALSQFTVDNQPDHVVVDDPPGVLNDVDEAMCAGLVDEPGRSAPA